jgi:hypothetical protein
MTACVWAKTWEDAKFFYYYAWFENDTLDNYFPTEETMRGLYFVGEYGSIDSMGWNKEYRYIFLENEAIYTGDSIWISKYWMDDSLLEEPVVMDRNVNMDDFRLLTFDSLHTEYNLSDWMDERAENVSWRSSLFMVYKKDSSYYALCLLGDFPSACDFYLSCQFQDDGTTNFEKIPNVENIKFEQCPASFIKLNHRSFINLPESIPYQVNGSRSRDNASSIVIQNRQPKLKLKK